MVKTKSSWVYFAAWASPTLVAMLRRLRKTSKRPRTLSRHPADGRIAELMADQFRSSHPENGESLEGNPAIEDEVVKAHEQVMVRRLGSKFTPLTEKLDALLQKPVPGLSRKALGPGPASSVIIEKLEKESAAYAKKTAEEYDDLREKVKDHEGALGFDFTCKETANDTEVMANEVLQHLKKSDITRFYETAPKNTGYGGQEHSRFYGDHFLSNADIIEQTQLFALCRAMPKGAHLHIHFNANLPPNFLLDIAKDMERMFIWSNIPLVEEKDRTPKECDAFDRCRIQFSIMSEAAVKEKGGNLFDSDYEGGKVMPFQDFLQQYPLKRLSGKQGVDSWLQSKLVFQEEEAHNSFQTSEG